LDLLIKKVFYFYRPAQILLFLFLFDGNMEFDYSLVFLIWFKRKPEFKAVKNNNNI